MTVQIVDYASLAQAMRDFAHRTDIANFQDYMIQFGQNRIVNDILKQNYGSGVKWQETSFGSLAIDPNSGYATVPADYIGMKQMSVSDGDGDQFDLLYKDTSWMYSNYPVRQPTGLPAYVAREGSNFIFGPFPDSAYTLAGYYYGRGPLLSSSVTTNWIITTAPDLFLAACMLELQPFIKGDSTQWAAIYQDKLTSLIAADTADKVAPGNLVTEVE